MRSHLQKERANLARAKAYMYRPRPGSIFEELAFHQHVFGRGGAYLPTGDGAETVDDPAFKEPVAGDDGLAGQAGIGGLFGVVQQACS